MPAMSLLRKNVRMLVEKLQEFDADAWSVRDAPKFPRLILVFLLLTVFLWGTLFNIEGATIAPGTIEAVTKRQKIQHEIGGEVSDIFIQDGQLVIAGQLLFKLDDSRVKMQIESRSFFLALAQAKLSKARAEFRGQSDFTFPSELLAFAASRPEISRFMEDLKELFFVNQSISSDKRGQFESNIKKYAQIELHLKQQITILEKQIIAARRNLTNSKELGAQGFATVTEIDSKRNQIQVWLRELEQLRAKLADTIASREANELSLRSLPDNIASQSGIEIQELVSQIAKTESEIEALRTELAAHEIRAQVSGNAILTKIITQGTVVSAGEVLVEIVPNENEFRAIINVPPQLVNLVHVGQEVELEVLDVGAPQGSRTIGHVSYVSADAITPETDTVASYFEIWVDISNTETVNAHILRPGLRANAFFLGERRSFAEYLVIPVAKFFERSFREPF